MSGNCELINALRKHPIREIATESQVSSATISKLLNNRAKLQAQITEMTGENFNRRKVKGFLQSMVKLCIFIKRNPLEILTNKNCFDLKIERAALEELIAEILFQLDKHELDFSSNLTTNDAIDIDSYSIGICKWEPFCEDVKYPSLSWGGRFCERLIKSINPAVNIKFSWVTDLSDAIIELQSTSDTSLDLVFGLYETSNRIHKKVDFIPLPNIFAKLGFLSPDKNISNWNDLIQKFNNNTINIICISQDISIPFLHGAFGDIQPEELSDFNEKQIFETFLGQYRNHLLASEKVPIIVAEQNTINSIYKKLSLEVSNKKSELANLISENRKGERFESLFKMASDEDNNTPKYRIGIAHLAKKTKLDTKEINFSLSQELFSNSKQVTENEYKILFRRDKQNGKISSLLYQQENSLITLISESI